MHPTQFQQQLVTTTSLAPPGGPWVVTTPPRPATLSSYQRHQSLYLGVALVVDGILSIAFNIVDLAVNADIGSATESNYMNYSLGVVGHGFWSGIACVIAGTFGILAWKRRSPCMIRSFVVLSILAACSSLAQLIVSVIGAAIVGDAYTSGYDNFCCSDNCYYYEYYNYYNYYNYYRYTPSKVCREARTLIAMESLLAVLGFIGGVTALWGSILGCRAACCCNCCCSCCCCKNPFPRPQQFAIVSTNGTQIIQMAIITQQQNGGQQLIPVQYPMQFPVQYPVNFGPPPYPGPVAGGFVQPDYQFTAIPPSCYPPPSTALVTSTQLPQPGVTSQSVQPLIPSVPAPPPIYGNC